MVFFGRLPGGEIWEAGFWMAGGLPSSDDAAQAQAQLVLAVFVSESDPPVIPELQANWWNAQTFLDGMRCYAYPTGGPSATYSGEYRLPSPLQGASANRVPNQVAVVASLRTGASGRKNRGRIYFPATGANFSATAQYGPGNVSTLAGDIAAAFADLDASSAGTPSVVSFAGSAHRPITSVVIDTRADIQRRRANKQTIDSAATAPVG